MDYMQSPMAELRGAGQTSGSNAGSTDARVWSSNGTESRRLTDAFSSSLVRRGDLNASLLAIHQE
jgi:hypothetical protein